jgi:molybdopterin molybdotransferase
LLARDAVADMDTPAFDRSTVDGYAVRAADTAGAGDSIPVFLRCRGEVAMGATATMRLEPGDCTYVPTGGMLPAGADAMVMVEYSEPCGEDAAGWPVIAIQQAVSVGRDIIRRGEDAVAGARLVAAGSLLRPAEIGLLALAGIAEPEVYRPPSLSLLSTGDEIIPPRQQPRAGEMRDVNSYALSALAQRQGWIVDQMQILPDDEAAIRQAVAEAMERSDIVAVSGGSSQGKKDMTARIIGDLAGGLLTHGLALKPGKPTILAFDRERQTLCLGLPGHPVSALMVFESLLITAWRQLTGQPQPRTITAHAEANIPGAAGRETLQPVQLLEREGEYLARAVYGKSGLISRLSQAEGYIIIDRNQEGIRAGEKVRVSLF